MSAYKTREGKHLARPLIPPVNGNRSTQNENNIRETHAFRSIEKVAICIERDEKYLSTTHNEYALLTVESILFELYFV